MAAPADTLQPEPARDGAESTPSPGRTSPARLLADRIGTRVVVAGGIAVIASILGILLFILVETWPLLSSARVDGASSFALPALPEGAILSDEYRELLAHLGTDGTLRLLRRAEGGVLSEQRVDIGDPTAEPPRLTRVTVAPGSSTFVAGTRDGRVLVEPIRWETTFEAGERRIRAEIEGGVALVVDPAGRPVPLFAGGRDDEGTTVALAPCDGEGLVLVRRGVSANEFTGETAETLTRSVAPLPVTLTSLVVDADVRNVYGGTASGALAWWRIVDGQLQPPQIVSPGTSEGGAPVSGAEVTALTLLNGHRSLVVGRRDGSIEVWFPVRQADGTFRLTPIRSFAPHGAAIRALVPSPRDKGFFALDETSGLGLYYSTSHRTMWTGRAPLDGASALFYAPKADALFVTAPGRVEELAVENPHPEVSLEALFARVWYEGYEEPRFTWQSSGGTDDFEPKLSLTPLLTGTLKGTFYSLVLAIPLALFGAMYTSQFMHHSLRKFVKPTVEIMAALPSVVLGFIAGLWLAPRLDHAFPALLAMIVVLPLAALATGWLWRALPTGVRGRFPTGTEALVGIATLALGGLVSLALGSVIESTLFGGRFQTWLLEVTGAQYDQRNAIVVGIAMGFAVIPIIFSVAEEAFSNVPQSLVAGSLALGASRWQTVTRVVLPTASAGIFSAIMIGFGRAVGETMIVLMATGNTPIMDWSPFNGFRTLSANIAVEIPEAPQGGTLYRTLFLAGLLLFLLTFAVNTVAEIVRQNLRRKFANL